MRRTLTDLSAVCVCIFGRRQSRSKLCNMALPTCHSTYVSVHRPMRFLTDVGEKIETRGRRTEKFTSPSQRGKG